MSKRVVPIVCVVVALSAAGCASSNVQVTRTPWTKTTPARPPSADTTRVRDDGPGTMTTTTTTSRDIPPREQPPARTEPDRLVSVTHMTDRRPPVLDSTVASVETETLPDAAGADSFASTFGGPGTVQEVGQDEILRSWPADADSAVPAPSVTASRALQDSTPANVPNDDLAAVAAPPAGDAAPFAVQLHAFPTRDAADFAARQAERSLRVDAWVEDVSGSPVPFKVYAGRFAERASADALRRRAQTNGFPEAFVVTRSQSR